MRSPSHVLKAKCPSYLLLWRSVFFSDTSMRPILFKLPPSCPPSLLPSCPPSLPASSLLPPILFSPASSHQCSNPSSNIFVKHPDVSPPIPQGSLHAHPPIRPWRARDGGPQMQQDLLLLRRPLPLQSCLRDRRRERSVGGSVGACVCRAVPCSVVSSGLVSSPLLSSRLLPSRAVPCRAVPCRGMNPAPLRTCQGILTRRYVRDLILSDPL